MTTVQQVAEAQAYARRRVVTAFVTGVLPERIASAPSPGRPLLAGLALAVLVAVGVTVVALLPR